MALRLTKKQKKTLRRIVIALVLFAMLEIADIAFGIFDAQPYGLALEFCAFLVPYLVAGYDVLAKAWHGIVHKQPLDENLLMTIASLGAFALVFFPESDPHMAEGAAVMIFYQVGEFFESYAVGKTRRSIVEMMDIAPEFANIMRDGALVQVDPSELVPGDMFVVKPGERVPLDGVVVTGSSQLDTSALTGESVPVVAGVGSEIVSGCVNETGVLEVRASKPYSESTVQRILDLVENASERKARTENFISRFARYYTPIVVGLAVVIAILSPFVLGSPWSSGVQSALVFLVVSCPCALVISVPLSFFSGIGAASHEGILIKGSSYLETLSAADTLAFDKTGTLTKGTFKLVAAHPNAGVDAHDLLGCAAHAEIFSNHPVALSVREGYAGALDQTCVTDAQEISGMGVRARVDGHDVLVGNDKLMRQGGIVFEECALVGTILHVARDGSYLGHIIIADELKDDAASALAALRQAGVKRTVMLTGDRGDVAQAVADKLGVDEVHAQLLPQDKVACVEELLAREKDGGKLVFVGDGINDAPVLMRSDVGIAMGAFGSDAAIEAADIVLMDDRLSQIARVMRIARKTMTIVRQNIIFAIGVKILIMILALPFIGIATMWLAVFGDVGVACLCILNAMRCLAVPA